MKDLAETTFELTQREQYHISNVALETTSATLTLTLKTVEDSSALWCHLYGQLTDNTEGYAPILYDMQNDPPEDEVVILESGLDQLWLILEYIETQLDNFLANNATAQLQKTVENHSLQKSSSTFFAQKSEGSPSDDKAAPIDSTLDRTKKN